MGLDKIELMNPDLLVTQARMVHEIDKDQISLMNIAYNTLMDVSQQFSTIQLMLTGQYECKQKIQIKATEMDVDQPNKTKTLLVTIFHV